MRPFSKIVQFWRENKAWKLDHIAAWSTASIVGADGMSPFQRTFIQTLRDEVRSMGLTPVDKIHVGDEYSYERIDLPELNVAVYVYDDQVDIISPQEAIVMEQWSARTPDELMVDALDHLRKLATKAGGRAT